MGSSLDKIKELDFDIERMGDIYSHLKSINTLMDDMILESFRTKAIAVTKDFIRQIEDEN